MKITGSREVTVQILNTKQSNAMSNKQINIINNIQI